MQKPFQTYFGGKESSGTYQTIINHIRPHKYFIEPFGGNFTISRKLNCDSIKLINDLSKEVFLRYPEKSQKFKFFNLDYKEFLAEVNTELSAPAVIYIDAPYLFESRKSQKEIYKKEFGNIDMHTELLTLAIKISKRYDVLISHYPHPLYFEMLNGWNYTEFENSTRNGMAKEVLWYNYDVTELADYSYLGDNRIDRQRIKRRKRLLVEKLKDLPTLERNAVLESLKAEFSGN